MSVAKAGVGENASGQAESIQPIAKLQDDDAFDAEVANRPAV